MRIGLKKKQQKKIDIYWREAKRSETYEQKRMQDAGRTDQLQALV